MGRNKAGGSWDKMYISLVKILSSRVSFRSSVCWERVAAKAAGQFPIRGVKFSRKQHRLTASLPPAICVTTAITPQGTGLSQVHTATLPEENSNLSETFVIIRRILRILRRRSNVSWTPVFINFFSILLLVIDIILAMVRMADNHVQAMK